MMQRSVWTDNALYILTIVQQQHFIVSITIEFRGIFLYHIFIMFTSYLLLYEIAIEDETEMRSYQRNLNFRTV